MGLRNVEYRQMDAEKMDLGDDSVDGVVCRFGYMLMADPAAALAETSRVLRDGGPLCFGVWGTPDRNPWAAVPGMTLVQRGHMPPPEPGAPGIFAMGDPDRIRSLTTGAGFGEPELEELEFKFEYADADDVWDAMVSLAGPLARVVKALPEEERKATRAADDRERRGVAGRGRHLHRARRRRGSCSRAEVRPFPRHCVRHALARASATAAASPARA